MFCYLRLRLIKRKISEKKKKEGREDRHSERHKKRETDWPGKEITIKSKKKKMYVILCYFMLTFIVTVVFFFPFFIPLSVTKSFGFFLFRYLFISVLSYFMPSIPSATSMSISPSHYLSPTPIQTHTQANIT